MKLGTIIDFSRKLRRQGLSIFRYSDISRGRIAFNLLRLVYYELLRRRYVIARVNDYRMVLDLQTPGLSRALLVYGKREILDTDLVQSEVSGTMNVLEVGANIGYYALMEATRLSSGKVYAIEPDPRNQNLLRRNAELNGCKDKIIVFPYAASDRSGKSTFYLGEKTNLSSMIKRSDSVAVAEVECIKLDDFPHIGEIDFVRMDIEGYECKVLEGMKQFLLSHKKPLKIFIEIHNQAYNDTDMNFHAQADYMLANGFRISHLITHEKHAAAFSARGYRSTKVGVETDIVRNLYENIAADDARHFLKKGMIRSLMFASDSQ